MSFSDTLRAGAADVWEAQHAHPFVRGLGDGTLPADRFAFYVAQDFRFLRDYGRVLSLGAARAPRLEWMRRFAELAAETLGTEMDLHRSLSARLGVPLDAAPAPVTAAYGDFLLRTAALGDFAELAAAVLPCIWSYAEIGARLQEPDHPDYRDWVRTYASQDFQRLAGWARAVVDEVAAESGPAVHERMRAAFDASSAYELGFWDAAWASTNDAPGRSPE